MGNLKECTQCWQQTFEPKCRVDIFYNARSNGFAEVAGNSKQQVTDSTVFSTPSVPCQRLSAGAPLIMSAHPGVSLGQWASGLTVLVFVLQSYVMS